MDEKPARSRNSEVTKAAILEAAKHIFANLGYEAAGVRQIAAQAGVDKMLINRYFGSKEELFRKAAESLLSAEEWMQGDRDSFGQRLASLLCFQEEKKEIDPLQFILRSASSPSASPILNEVVRRKAILPLAAWIGGPNAEERAGLLLSQIAGFGLLSFVLKIEPFASGSSEKVASLFAAELQKTLFEIDPKEV